MIGMQNLSSIDKKSGIQYQESGTYVLEERSWITLLGAINKHDDMFILEDMCGA